VRVLLNPTGPSALTLAYPNPLVPLPEAHMQRECPQRATRKERVIVRDPLTYYGRESGCVDLHACSQTGLYTAQCTIGGNETTLLHKAEDCEVRPELLSEQQCF
jgi:hypothetical protein